MRRERLREAWSEFQIAAMYAEPHDHRAFPDHQVRVDATIVMGLGLLGNYHGIGPRVAADLSCGNGAILAAMPVDARLFGDLAPGYDYTGPIEQTVQQIPDVDLFVCCETIEHLDDPDATLAAIGDKARRLLLSTPVDAWDDANPEHYWAWDREAVEAMVVAAGFTVLDYREVWPSYKFGIWACGQ